MTTNTTTSLLHIKELCLSRHNRRQPGCCTNTQLQRHMQKLEKSTDPRAQRGCVLWASSACAAPLRQLRNQLMLGGLGGLAHWVCASACLQTTAGQESTPLLLTRTPATDCCLISKLYNCTHMPASPADVCGGDEHTPAQTHQQLNPTSARAKFTLHAPKLPPAHQWERCCHTLLSSSCHSPLQPQKTKATTRTTKTPSSTHAK